MSSNKTSWRSLGMRLSAALLLLLFFSLLPATANGRLRIAIMDFSAHGVAPHLGQATGELLRTYFSGAGGIEVLERAQMEALAREQKLQLSGLVDESTAVKAGKLLGANYIVVGAVNAFGSTLVLTARLLDVQGSRSVSGFDKKSQRGEDGLYDIAMELAAELLSKLAPQSTPTRTPTPAQLETQGSGLRLQWDLSKERRDDKDEKGRYRVYTVSDGWRFEVNATHFSASQGLSLPSRARYLFRYETEAEILSLEGRVNTGIYMGKDGVALYFEIHDTETQLRVAHGGQVRFVTSGALPKKLVPPAKIKMLYDVDTGEISGFIDGAPVASWNAKKLPNLPGLTSITYTGVFVSSAWDSRNANGVFRSINFVAR